MYIYKINAYAAYFVKSFLLISSDLAVPCSSLKFYLALSGLILPEVKVDFWNISARYSLIQKLVGLVKYRLLNFVHHIAVLADYLNTEHNYQFSQII